MPLKDDKATQAINVSGLVAPIPDDLVKEAEQAAKELELDKAAAGA